jgi:O-antigen/teichoic acid export membrane protein
MDTRVYLRQFMILATGSAAAQVINFAAYPIITRLYSPAEFGVFALFVTAVGLIGPIAAGRFDLIVQSAKDRELMPVFALSQLINLGVTVAAAVGFLIYTGIDRQDLGPEHAFLVGIGIFLTGFCNAAGLFVIRHERYLVSTRAAFARALITVAAQIGLWFIWPGPVSLALGFCLGFGMQAALLAFALRDHELRRPRALHLRAVWARYRSRAMVDVPSTLVGALVLNILNIFLLLLYSAEEVGQYAFAFRVAVLPLVLFATALADVYYQKAAASYRATGGFWPQMRFNLLASAGLAVAMFVPMVFLARPVFALLFDERYLPAADILIYLSPMLAARFVATSIQSTPLVVNRVHWLFANHLGLVVAMAAAYVAAEAAGLSLPAYLILNTVLMSGVYLAFTVFLVVTVRRSYR